MALLIDIEKTKEDDFSVTLKYWQGTQKPGLFRFEKSSGAFVLVERCEGDKGDILFARAQHRVAKALREVGEIPDRLVYAA